MKALMMLMVLLGVAAIIAPRFAPEEQGRGVQAVAMNYAVYRNAAFLYALKNRPAGSIPHNLLGLPSEWQALRSWSARVESGRCYVFGPASAEEIAAARDLFHGSFAVGRAENGLLMPDGRTPLPGFVPGGSLVSVIEVR